MQNVFMMQSYHNKNKNGSIWMSTFILGCILVLLLSCSYSEDFKPLVVKDFPERNNDFSLWQLEPFFEEVQMGYILRSDKNKIIVVDGGGKIAAPILESYLSQLGGKVDTWILTHPHADHITAFLEIMDKGSIKVGQVLHVNLPDEWVLNNEPDGIKLNRRLGQAISKSKVPETQVAKGDYFALAEGVEMNVFGAFNEEITSNAINNSSMVFQIKSKSKSVLFLGDLGPEGGRSLLKKYAPIQIQSDYVQMSHHGQAGVDRDFYTAVNAKYALWPTPEWLWHNQLEGKSVNSGSFKTLVVRSWMEELGISKHYVSGLEGTIQID